MTKTKMNTIRDWAKFKKRSKRTKIKMTEYKNGKAQKTQSVVW